jgi:DNA-binding response OmpR family regulator
MSEETKYSILVVDDEDDLCEILRFNLETEGYQVTTANSAEEALRLDLTHFNLMLLDVMMDGMSGFAMAKQVKANPETAHIPIVFLTARDTENDTVTGFNLGADDYISKPFSIREVLVRVRAVHQAYRRAAGHPFFHAELPGPGHQSRPQDRGDRWRRHRLHQDRV